jgi:lysophospholipase L1-like esterase
MTFSRPALLTSALLLTLSAAVPSAQRAARNGTTPAHWIPTWTTSQQLVRFPAAQPAATAAPAPATSTNGQAPPPAAAPAPLQGLRNQTLRMIARTSIGGRRVRVKLANAFNGPRVEIGAAHIALRDKDSAIVTTSDRALTFGGASAVKIAPGAVVVSDPVDLALPPLTDVAVSLYFPGETGPPTTHARGLRTTYISTEGNHTASAAIAVASTQLSYYWLAAIEVDAAPDARLIVAFGDSITDGSQSTPDTNNPWPAILATRLAAGKATANIAVANQGIGGNRVLSDGTLFQGVSALARLDRDVLSQPGATWLIVLEGINDIGNATAGLANVPPLTANDLIQAHRQIIDRAHTHGIKVIGATLTPFEGASYFREEGETIRQALNQWIRTSGAYDAVIDFEAVVRDPANPRRIKADFDPGDHLHPNDAGYRAMAEAIDLRIFGLKAQASGLKQRP